MSKNIKENITVFGPYFGCLRWEIVCFSAFYRYIRNKYKNCKFAVMVRNTSFDLYNNSDIFFSLENYGINCSDGYVEEHNQKTRLLFIKNVKDNLRNKYHINYFYYPEIKNYMYKVKWQFPRIMTDYNFQPREKSIIKAENHYDLKENFLILDNIWMSEKTSNAVIEQVSNIFKEKIICTKDIFSNKKFSDFDNSYSKLGIFIEMVRNCDLFIGNLNSDFSLFPCYMSIPFFSILKDLDKEDIFTLNINPKRIKKLKLGGFK